MTIFDAANFSVSEAYRSFEDNGFLIIRGGLSQGYIDEIKLGIEEFFKRNQLHFGKFKDTDGHYPRIVNLHLAFKPLFSLFENNKAALAIQDMFFGTESSMYTSLYYERGSAQPIHRDTPYFSTKPEHKYLGVWVALEDADTNNGCLEVIRGAHKLPELALEEIAREVYLNLDEIDPNSDQLWSNYQGKLMNQCLNAGLKIEALEVLKGDTVIWHPQLPHGGSQIMDLTRTRHSFVMHVTPMNTPVYHQDVFFNPDKIVPSLAAWNYAAGVSRRYVDHNEVNIAHAHPLPPDAFV